MNNHNYAKELNNLRIFFLMEQLQYTYIVEEDYLKMIKKNYDNIIDMEYEVEKLKQSRANICNQMSELGMYGPLLSD